MPIGRSEGKAQKYIFNVKMSLATQPAEVSNLIADHVTSHTPCTEHHRKTLVQNLLLLLKREADDTTLSATHKYLMQKYDKKCIAKRNEIFVRKFRNKFPSFYAKSHRFLRSSIHDQRTHGYTYKDEMEDDQIEAWKTILAYAGGGKHLDAVDACKVLTNKTSWDNVTSDFEDVELDETCIASLLELNVLIRSYEHIDYTQNDWYEEEMNFSIIDEILLIVPLE